MDRASSVPGGRVPARPESRGADPGGASPAVAALYGWDLDPSLGIIDPEKLLSEGFDLLALDRPAVTALATRDLAFSTVEDWLTRTGSDGATLRSIAASAAEGWADHHPLDVTTDGVHWPELEHLVQPELWSALAAGGLLVSAFRDAGVTRLRFVLGHPVHPDAPGSAPDGNVALLWMRLLPDIAEPLLLPRGAMRTRLRIAVSGSPLGRALRLGRFAVAVVRLRVAMRGLPPTPSSGRAVLALAGRELLRSAPIVRTIQEHLGPAVVALPWMNSIELTREAGRLSPAPTLPTPRLERGSWREERRLRRGVLRNLAEHDLGELEVAREEVTVALTALSVGWAMHARRLRWMRWALRALDTRLVVATRLDVAYEVPVEAARSLGIPVLTLPHGVQEWSPPSRLVPNAGVAHVAGIANPTAAPGVMRVSADALIEYEYPHRVRAPRSASDGQRFTVLAVTDGFGSVNRPSTGIRTHASALETLSRIADERSGDLRVLLKPHPGTPEDERLLIRGKPEGALEFLSREDDLIALLAEADLVLGVNCHGTSLVHAVRAGVPVVRFLTEDPAAATGSMWAEQRGWAGFWDEMLPSVRDATELERLVDRVFGRPEELAALVAMSLRTADRLVPRTGQERLVDIIDELLSVTVSD